MGTGQPPTGPRGRMPSTATPKGRDLVYPPASQTCHASGLATNQPSELLDWRFFIRTVDRSEPNVSHLPTASERKTWVRAQMAPERASGFPVGAVYR